MTDDEVVVEERLGVTRVLVLNRPRQLNALNHPMVHRLLELLVGYEQDPSVKLLILKGKGRAFCAGGDVASVVRDISVVMHYSSFVPRSPTRHLCLNSEHNDFFREEFTLNYLLATYSKPQVSILNGIVMGGGAGASIHGRFRVTTQNSNMLQVFAMPETALGLFPDVGASYFLSRLPGFFGEYLGLTGSRLDGAEMLFCGLATHFVPAEKLSSLEEELYKANSSDPAIIVEILDGYSQRPTVKQQSACHRSSVINRCFSLRTVKDILSALENEVKNKADDWTEATIQSLKRASPTSLKISLKSIREGRLQGVGQCLVREYRMVCHVMQGKLSKDFFEGCRAILLDKDKNPKWDPPRLELVSDEKVEQYFSKIDDNGWQDLKLPARRNLSGYAVAKL